jgi:glycosyltransferase involved in cell wall biosynthesis
MNIAIVYDCLYPNTVGGAERWYRNLAESLDERHSITYITRRQWGDEGPQTSFKTLAVAPGGKLYTRSGRRRIVPPVRFGAGVFWHMLRHGRSYDVVHSASFPYFSVIGAAFALAIVRSRARLIVDWFEVWSRDYWVEYIGRLGGRVGYFVQARCARVADQSFTFSSRWKKRLMALNPRGKVVSLRGLYAENHAERQLLLSKPRGGPPVVIFAGRHIPEKRVPTIPPAIAAARQQLPTLRCVIFGDGPDTEAVTEEVRSLGLDDVVELAGTAPPAQIAEAFAEAACVLQPSRREGYGLIVVEAVSLGTPVIVVEGSENASVELIEPGINGLVASSTDPDQLGQAVINVVEGGAQLRRSTLDWYERNRETLSLQHSLRSVEASYLTPLPRDQAS